MHLLGFRRAGIQIWDFWMLKVSDTGNHNESSPIPISAKTVIPKPSKLCVTLQAKCERCVYLLQILKVKWSLNHTYGR